MKVLPDDSSTYRIIGYAALSLAHGILSPFSSAEETVVEMQIPSARVQGSEEKEFVSGQIGVRGFSEDDIAAFGDSRYDPNELLETLPNIQFADDRFRLGPDELGNLQPAEISISGARPGENNFVIDGVGTNNLLDSLSQRAFNQVTASVQSVFIDADLLAGLEVYDANVPAEYGDFLGGVVVARTRDPAHEFGGRIKVDYASSDFVDYLLDAERIDRGTPPVEKFPEPTAFTRVRVGFDLDVPVQEGIRTLFSFNRAVADVTRDALSSSYFPERRTRSTVRDNFLAKVAVDIGDRSLLTLSTLWTPYEDQYWRSNLNRQYGGGSTTKLRWTTDWEDRELEVRLSHTTTDNDREEEADHFIYAETPAITADPFDDLTKLRGGFGDFESSQRETELSVKHRWSMERGRISVGMDLGFIAAERGRPATVFGYRDGVAVALPPGATIVEENPVEGTVIAEEQVLLERNDYRAFSAEADIFETSAFIDAKRMFVVKDWLTLRPSLGLRLSYDDFLGNGNPAPRGSLTAELPYGLAVTVGLNRYYAKNQLLYALREQDPDNFVYKRTLGFDAASNSFTVSDFALVRQTRSTRYSGSDLNTPYSDEASIGLTATVWEFGEIRIKGLLRRTKDGFARSEPIVETGTNEEGETFSFERYELTNRGSGEYRSLSLEWAKTIGNSTFTLSTTLSENEIAPGTDTLLSNTDLGRENERVLFEGRLLGYNELNIERENFNTPSYISGTWIGDWFEGALTTSLRGRFRPAYERIVNTGELTDIPGEEGSPFEVYEVQSLAHQFVVDAVVKWRISTPADTRFELRLNIDNVFNFVPNVPVTRFNPYQQGRSFSFGATLRF